MKTTETIQRRIEALRSELSALERHNTQLVQYKRYEDAAKGMQRERSIRDQVALLEWVLK